MYLAESGDTDRSGEYAASLALVGAETLHLDDTYFTPISEPA